ncbi:CHAT domain-containing protein [Micromonospora chersina]|uniref:CHAT domain-containing protein n=1 Tax=Micromonospora chersina TaxID=47854 RepID=UPI0033DBC6D2
MLTRKLEAGDPTSLLDPATAAELAALANLATGAEDYAVAEILARIHWARYRLLPKAEDQRDLDGTIAWTPRLLPGIPRGDPYGTELVLNLGTALVQRWARTGSVAALDLAIGVLEDEATAVVGVNLAIVSHATGIARRLRFGELARLADLEWSIEWHRRALAAFGDRSLRAQYLVDLAEVLLRHFDHVRHRPELEEAIRTSQAALDRSAPGQPPHAAAWSVLGQALLSRAEYYRAADDLEASVAALDAAVAESSVEDPVRVDRLSKLSEALRARFERAGDMKDIDRAVATARAGVRAARSGSSHQAGCLTALAMALVRRHDRTGALADLAQAIEAAQAAVDGFKDPRNRAVAQSNLATALQRRYQRTGSSADLDRAISLLREAFQAGERGIERFGILGNLGLLLSSRYERHRRGADLDAAIAAMGEAAVGIPVEHANWPGLAGNLGFTLRMRFEETGEASDLDDALQFGQQAVDATPDGDRALPGHLSNLSNTWLRKYEHSSALNDLERARELGRQAVMKTPPGGREALDIRSGYASVLLKRFDRLGERDDLTEAIATFEQILEAAPGDDPARGRHLSQLAKALVRRFERTDAAADLDRAIQALRQALATVPVDHPERAAYINRLAIALRDRFERTGTFADVDEAISIVRAAYVALTPAHPDRRTHAAALATVLTSRFSHSGNAADLDEAITLHRRAVLEFGSHHAAHADLLSNLAAALLERFQRTGAIADADEAVDAGRRAVAATRDNDASRALHYSNLGAALHAKFERTGDPADLQEGIANLQMAVETTPRGHGDRALYLANLSRAVELGYAGPTDDPTQLDAAVALSREALDAMPDDHPRRPGVLSNLSLALLYRFAVKDQAADLEQAEAHARKAVSLSTSEHPHRAVYLNNLGLCYLQRAALGGDGAVRQQAIAAFREATAVATAPAVIRARAGREWALVAASGGDLAAASTAWDKVFELLPLVMDRGLDRRDRQHHIATLGGVGRNAAMVAIGRGDVATAWSLLEQGRGVLLSQALQGRSENDRLRGHLPELADEVERIRRLLNADTPSEERRVAAEAWQRLLMTIRALPDFERFALPPTVEELRRAAAGGTVVAVNIAPHRCDCLLLDEHGEDLVPLSDLTMSDAVKQANRLLAATRAGSSAAISDVLRWLWDHVASPILDHLATDTPRIWWLPTGPLTVMPLHAAGYHDERGRCDGRTVMDRAVSSYTSTVRALHHARRRPPAPGQRALAVGINSVPGLPALNYAAAEAKDVHRRFAAASTLLLGEDATRERILAGLDGAAWAHFACHAAEAADPADSYLALSDGPLPAKEIMSRELDQPFLAFLSACTTAFGGTSLIDEAIHMASAFQVAGFPHAIGTLWPVADAIAPAFTRLVYDKVLAGSEPALALHDAARHVRGLYPDHPQLWAAYVHFGP